MFSKSGLPIVNCMVSYSQSYICLRSILSVLNNDFFLQTNVNNPVKPGTHSLKITRKNIGKMQEERDSSFYI